MEELNEYEVTLVLRVKAKDLAAAGDLAFDLNQHIRSTFNDNDTIGASAFKVEPVSGPEPFTKASAYAELLDAYVEMEVGEVGAGEHGALGRLREILKAGAPYPSPAFLIRYCRDKGLDDGTDGVLEAIEFLEKNP